MTRICIVALIGLPAAGKTSFCRWLLQTQQLNCAVYHVCYDELLPPFDPDTTAAAKQYKSHRWDLLEKLQSLVEALRSKDARLLAGMAWRSSAETATKPDKLIVCDDNHYYRSMRQQLYKICRQLRVAFAQIHFTCDDLPILLQRNAQRSGAARLPQDVLETMCTRLERPLPQQYYWEANTFHWPATESTLEADRKACLAFIASAFDEIPAPVTLASEQQEVEPAASTLHQLDVLLRQRVKQLLTASGAPEKQVEAARLNAKRKAILHDFREARGNLARDPDHENMLQALVNTLK